MESKEVLGEIKGMIDEGRAQNEKEMVSLKEYVDGQMKAYNSKLYADEVSEEITNAYFEATLAKLARKEFTPGMVISADDIKATKSFAKVEKAVSTSDTAVFQQTATNQIARDVVEQDWLGRIQTYSVSGPSLQVPKLPSVSGVVLLGENSGDTYQQVTAGSASLTSAILTPKALGCRIAISRQAVEQSYIDLVGNLRVASMRALRNAIMDVIINGAGSDANFDDGLGELASDSRYKAWSGLRLEGIGAKTDASTLTTTVIYNNLAKLGLYADDNVLALANTAAYCKVADKATNLYYDKGVMATGQLPHAFGCDWVKTNLIPLTDGTTGQIEASGNTYSSIVMFQPWAYALGIGRNFGMEVEYSARSQSYDVIPTITADFKNTTSACVAGVMYKL